MYQKFVLILLSFALLFSSNSAAQEIFGTISDESGAPVPFVSVAVVKTGKGTTSNDLGKYSVAVPSGENSIQFSAIGFTTLTKKINISKRSRLEFNVTLTAATTNLAEAEIVANPKDKAKEIMRQVRDKRKDYNENFQTYKAEIYTKTFIDRQRFEPIDTLNLLPDSLQKKYRKRKVRGKKFDTKLDSLARQAKADLTKEDFYPYEIENLVEQFGFIYHEAPKEYKTEILAVEDRTEEDADIFGNGGVSVGITVERNAIMPQYFEATNPYILYEGPRDCDFNFYNNYITYDRICQKPILSPIATSSAVSYKYMYDGVTYEDGKKIFILNVEPIFKNEPLFEGKIYIADGTFHLHRAELRFARGSTFYADRFDIVARYSEEKENVFLPSRLDLDYHIKSRPWDIGGKVNVIFSNYAVDVELPPKFYTPEIVIFDEEAYSRDSTYWSELRPTEQTEDELEFIAMSDSIHEYHTSDEFYFKKDSVFNRISIWSPFVGLGHRNRAKRTEWFISGLLEQVNPLGIGGYRHQLPGYFNYRLKNDMLLETDAFIDYGFRNADVKGRVGVGLTYKPRKFMRTFVRLGDFYQLVNNFASIQQIFSRSNYTRVQSISIAQRMEIFNGLYGEMTLFYADQVPLTNIAFSKWSGNLFGELNEPIDFERYTRSEIKFEFIYQHKQEYIYKKNRKIVYGSKYPTLSLTYRKGIPGLFNSEVNYDYIEFGMSNRSEIGRWGTTNYSGLAGTYLNKNNLRVLEHKYFRGSDLFFFSNPTQSFQLLGLSLSTPNEFLRLNGVHHFEGTILNKVPVVNWLKLQLAVGAGTLLIPDSKFAHAEFFAGLERTVVWWGQPLRFGVYAVTSDNTIDKGTDFTFKFGVNFYNTFNNLWDY